MFIKIYVGDCISCPKFVNESAVKFCSLNKVTCEYTETEDGIKTKLPCHIVDCPLEVKE
jgi:hypothetical protein